MIRRALYLAAVTASVVATPSAHAFNRLFPSCGGAFWSSSARPVPYFINQAGYSPMPFATVQRIFGEAFAVWSQPCCSDFSAAYQGTTSGTAINSTSQHVLSFYEGGWPSTYGDVNTTIAVTPVAVQGGCVLVSGDILYNATGFGFIEGDPGFGNNVDLMSISVHEMGHFLGLDHSSVSGSSLRPSYSGGIVERDLHQDDIDGVCTVYPGSCNCSIDSNCSNGQVCINQRCTDPPCTSNASCDPGLECDPISGLCIEPPCISDADCIANYRCETNGECVPDGDCPICLPCSQNFDCSTTGVCADLGSGLVCIEFCNDGNCPGDSVCFQVPAQNGTVLICLNPEAATGDICPATYVCIDDCSGVSCPPGETCNSDTGLCETDFCDGLGNDCANSGALCTPDNDVCVGVDGGSICSCRCASDADCGPGNSCEDFGGGNFVCIIGGGGGNPCDTVTCSPTETCDPLTGNCVAPKCAGLWNDCSNGGIACTVDNDACVTEGGASYCTCRCTSDAECGLEGVCRLGDGSPCAGPGCVCRPADTCASLICAAAATCDGAKGCCVDALGVCWVDSDGDGVSDGIDNCPSLANARQDDTNQNGIGDLCEGGADGGTGPADGGGGGGDDSRRGFFSLLGCDCSTTGGSPVSVLAILLCLVVLRRRHAPPRAAVSAHPSPVSPEKKRCGEEQQRL